jgi:hypothetical protein
MASAIDALNSRIGSGQKNMALNGLKALFRWIGGEKTSSLTVESGDVDGPWYIMDGENILAGPYKTRGAAKGQLTRLLKGYTPASRRPE